MVRRTYKKHKLPIQRKIYGGSIQSITKEIIAYIYKNKFSLGFTIIQQLPTLATEMNTIPVKFYSLNNLFQNGKIEEMVDSIKNDSLFISMFNIIKKIISTDYEGIKTLINNIFWEAIDNVTEMPGMPVELKVIKDDPDIKKFVELIITKLLDLITKNDSLSQLIDHIMEKAKTAREQIPESAIKSFAGGSDSANVDIDIVFTKITDLLIKAKPELKDKITEFSDILKPVLNSIIGEPTTISSTITKKHESSITKEKEEPQITTKNESEGSQQPHINENKDSQELIVASASEGSQQTPINEIQGSPLSVTEGSQENDNPGHLPIIPNFKPNDNDDIKTKYEKCTMIEKVTGLFSGELPPCLKNSGGGTRKNKKKRTKTLRRSKYQKNISKKYKK